MDNFELAQNLSLLSDHDIIFKTDEIVKEERSLLTKLLYHLREIERRRLFSSLGYKSLFDYAIKRLGYSEDQAARRIVAMRLLKELPQIEQKISDGSLTLSNIGKAQTLFLKEKKFGQKFSENKKLQLLETLENKSAREADKIILESCSQPMVLNQERVRQITPLISEIKFSADDKLLNKIEKLKGLLAHSNPNISLNELFDKLCDLGIQKWDLGAKPTPKNPNRKTAKESESSLENAAPLPATSQKQRVNSKIRADKEEINDNRPSRLRRPHIPLKIQREIWQEANSQCEFCGSIFALEIDHRLPKAKGGLDKRENLRLLCRHCNQRQAIEQYGQRTMDSYM